MQSEKKNKPKLSIITVAYNSEKVIESTLVSVLNQTFKNFEYIIIDGNSTDKTIQIIELYKPKFKKININLVFITEPDNGIYDAMNKAITLANGEWCNFMNTGDFFLNDNVLDIVFNSNKSYKEIAILYGYKVFKNKKIKPQSLNVLKYGLIMGNHQSMFFNKNILKNELIYDLKYTIYGDYELVNKIFLKYGYKRFLYVDLPIVNYLGGGISSKPTFQKRKDKFLILYSHYGIVGVLRGIYFTLKEKLFIYLK